MTDDDTEVVAFTNVATSARSVTITFYDDVGTLLDTWIQNIDPLHTDIKTFPLVPEGEFVAYEVTVSGTGPSILANFIAFDPAGPMSSYSPSDVLSGP